MNISPETFGVHYDLDARFYHSLPGASASQLRKLWQSTPAHLKASLDEPREETPAMMMGTLAHSVILEPEKPLPGIVIPPDEYEPGKKWTNAAKVCKEWRAAREAEGLLVVKADEYNAVMGMARSIAAHPLAGPMLAYGRPEVSLVTMDEGNGVVVRARVDFVPLSGPTLMDIKTTASAAASDFQRKAYDMGYHIQAALYLALWNALTGEERTGFQFIVVENTPPHAVNVFECEREFLERGASDFKRALATYAQCVRDDNWPAYPATMQQLNIPKWAV